MQEEWAVACTEMPGLLPEDRRASARCKLHARRSPLPKGSICWRLWALCPGSEHACACWKMHGAWPNLPARDSGAHELRTVRT